MWIVPWKTGKMSKGLNYFYSQHFQPQTHGFFPLTPASPLIPPGCPTMDSILTVSPGGRVRSHKLRAQSLQECPQFRYQQKAVSPLLYSGATFEHRGLHITAVCHVPSTPWGGLRLSVSFSLESHDNPSYLGLLYLPPFPLRNRAKASFSEERGASSFCSHLPSHSLPSSSPPTNI